MATIQNSIVLNDRMTQTFTAINNAISATVNSLSSLDGKSMNINTANLSTARQQLALAENELQKMKGDSKGLNDNLSKTPGIVDAIQKKMIQAGTAIAGVMGAKQLLQASDQNAQITARLNLITDAPEQLKEQIYQSANDARVAYTDSMNQVAKLGLLAKDAFNNTDEIVQFTNLMQKAFKVSGADAVEATSAMYQLTQAMAAGKLQGDEFRSVMENAPMVAQAIAKHMNVSVGELKKLGAEGQITADIIKNALFSAGDDINAKFRTLPLTWSDIWTQAKNFALREMDGILKKINQLANSQAFQSFITNMKIGFIGLKAVVNGIVDGIAMAGKFIADNWQAISPVVYGVTAALIWYGAVQAIAALASVWSTMATIAQCIALLWQIATEYAAIVATEGLAAAQTTLNSAIWAFPGTWLAAVIVGLIVLILWAAVAITQWATGTQSALETVGGMFYWFAALVSNIFIILWDIIVIFVSVVILAFIGLGTLIVNVFIGIWNAGVWLVNALLQGWYWMVNGAAMVWAWLKVTISNILKGIYNFFVGVANGFIDGYNAIGRAAVTVANGFHNAFANAINSLARMVENFVNGFLRGLNEIGKVVDSVIGTHFSNGGALQISLGRVGGGGGASFTPAQHIQAMAYGDANGVKVAQKQAPKFGYAGYADPSGLMEGVMNGAGKLTSTKLTDLGGAFDDGKNATRKGIKGITDGFNKGKDELMNMGKNLPGDKGAGGDKGKGGKGGGGGKDPNNKKTADNTGKMADKMDDMNEDMKYLRDIAEREYINKFTTAEIKIDMTNYNNISEQADADDFIDALGERLAEHVYTGAEGVHSD